MGSRNRNTILSPATKPRAKRFDLAQQFVRLPLLNDDMHVVGWEMARVGPSLAADVRRVAAEGRL